MPEDFRGKRDLDFDPIRGGAALKELVGSKVENVFRLRHETQPRIPRGYATTAATAWAFGRGRSSPTVTVAIATSTNDTSAR